jgi:hypothetical protein
MYRLVLPLALLLAGCETTGPQWVKQGADAQALRVDQDTCSRESQRYAYMDPSTSFGYESTGRNYAATFSAADSYRTCMGRLGWHRETR